jgi:hypothetical protein
MAQKAVEAYDTRRNSPASVLLIDANYESLKQSGLNINVLGQINNDWKL